MTSWPIPWSVTSDEVPLDLIPPRGERRRPYRLLTELPNRDRVPRILTREQALALGLSRHAIAHRVATGQWAQILPRTYLTGSTLTWSDKIAGALAFAGPGALLSGAAALDDLGLRSLRRSQEMLVLVPSAARVRPAGWVRVRRTHRLPAASLLPGPRRVGPARALADWALEQPELDDVRAVLAQAVRAHVCSVPELWDELADGPMRGSKNLRAAVRDLDAGAWSAPEARAAAILRRARVPKFEQNATIELPGGRVVRVDFLWRELRAVLEIDSVIHHDDPSDRDATDDRHAVLETLGLSVLHVRPARMLAHPTQFRRRVEDWLTARSVEINTLLRRP